MRGSAQRVTGRTWNHSSGRCTSRLKSSSTWPRLSWSKPCKTSPGTSVTSTATWWYWSFSGQATNSIFFGGQINDPLMGEILLSSVPPSNLHLGTLEGLFELSRHPARAPDLPRVLLPELKDTVICAALGVEVPGHRLKQLTLMLRLLKACFFTHRSLMMKSQQNRIELVTRLALDLSHGRSDGRIDTVEGQSYELESIFEQFNNQQCPYLKGKPKFFIIQVRFWIVCTSMLQKFSGCYYTDSQWPQTDWKREITVFSGSIFLIFLCGVVSFFLAVATTGLGIISYVPFCLRSFSCFWTRQNVCKVTAVQCYQCFSLLFLCAEPSGDQNHKKLHGSVANSGGPL